MKAKLPLPGLRLARGVRVMAGTALQRHSAQLMAKLYPAFSRRATQVCILSAALEKIEAGLCIDPRTVAREALEQANPFDWVARSKTPNVGGEARLAAHQPSQTTTATPQGVASTDQLGGRVRSEKD